MADTKITAMPAAATLDGTEIVPLVQTGGNVQATVTNFVSQTIQVNPGDFRDDLGLGTMALQDSDNVSITGGAISDTTVAGYVPTTRTLTAGVGLSGGGDLSANRTFDIEDTGVAADIYGSTTQIPVITVNAQGQITDASEVSISPAALGLAYFSGYQNGTTTLTSAIPNSTSTSPIAVVSTAGFGSSGNIIIGEEIIGYTSKTSTAFGGTITRGVFSTSKSSHAIGSYASEAYSSAVGTATVAPLDTVVLSSGVTCTVPDSKIYFTNTGKYNIQYSVQLLNYTTAEDNVTVWFRKNGADIDNTASVEQVNSKYGTSPGARVLAINIVDAFNAGDYVELVWCTDSGETVLATYPPQTSPTRPASPSLILTVTQVA